MMLVFSTLAIVGCSQGGVSKGVATDAIQKALDTQKICVPWKASDPNKELLFVTLSGLHIKETVWEKDEQRFSTYKKAGLIEIHPALASAVQEPSSVNMEPMLSYGFVKANDASLVRIKLTEAGKKYFSPSSSGEICGGRRVVTEVLNWSEPAPDSSGVIVSQVAFKASVQDIPAQLNGVITGPSIESVKGVMQIRKMSDGWVSNSFPQYEKIQGAVEKKEPLVANLAKPNLNPGEAYVGTLACAGKELGYAIRFKAGEGNTTTAVTSFFSTAKNPELQSGCFTSKGAFYGNSGVLAMRFDSWLLHPPGYTGSNVSAVVRGNEMEAVVPVNGCKPFILVRATLPESIPSSCKAAFNE